MRIRNIDSGGAQMARIVKSLNIVINDKHARILQAMAAESKRSSTSQGQQIIEDALEAWAKEKEFAVVYRV